MSAIPLGSASAADLSVPAQFVTIQAAIDAASPGDRVLISPGRYRESINVSKSLTIEAVESALPGEVVITGIGVPGPAMYLGGSTYSGPVVIRGLTFDGESVIEAGQFAGLFAGDLGADHPLLIEKCIFQDLRNPGTDGGAIWLGQSPTIVRRCLFLRNQAAVHGAAIYASDNASATCEDCAFLDNRNISGGSGIFYARVNASISVTRSVVRNVFVLAANHVNGVLTFSNNVGCQVTHLSNGGYVDGGGNNWLGPCPDCEGDGQPDLAAILLGQVADCGENLIPDSCDILAGEPDVNGNGVPDTCDCPADINQSGTIDAEDLAYVLFAWGMTGGKAGDADINGDATVDANDLSLVLGSWGPCPN